MDAPAKVDDLETVLGAFDDAAPLAHARTPPSAWYLDPRVYEAELERVFFRTWQPVGHVHEVARPGQHFGVDLAGEPVVVVRGDDGALRAFSNVCRHRGATVAACGAGEARSLRCPYHGWIYGLDGKLCGGPPEFEGVEGFDRGRNGLPPLRVDTFGPFVLVCLDADAPPLAEALGDLPERQPPADLLACRFAERRVYEVACNWKVYIDNYLEAYHVPHVHPALNAVLDYQSYVTEPKGPYVLQWSPTRKGSDASGAGVEYTTYAPEGSEARYWWVFPGFMLNVYANVVSGNYIRPLGKDRTLCVFDFFFRTPEGVAESVRASDDIQQEDMAICGRVQAGLRSRSYRTGRYSVARENGLHHFHLLLARALKTKGDASRT
jgi:choline monooxygenase